jgi:DHA2 family multidrug resistance protein
VRAGYHVLVAGRAPPSVEQIAGSIDRTLQTGAASWFWNPESTHGAAILNEEITRQANIIIGYVDDLKLLMILSLMALPLILLIRPLARTQSDGTLATEI